MPHKIDFLLTCNHINEEALEAAIFIPSIGDKRICNLPNCKKDVMIAKIGSPFWVDDEVVVIEPIKKSKK